MRGVVGLLSLATSLWIALAAFADDRVIRDDARHFQFERPEAWTACNPNVTDAMRAFTASQREMVEDSTGKQCDFAVISALDGPCDDDGRPSLFFVALFHRWIPRPHTYAGIEKCFSTELTAAGAALAARLRAQATTHSDAVVDRARGRVTSHGTMAIDGVGVVPSYSVGVPGKEGMVLLQAFAHPADAEAAWKLVDGIADSFRWDDGYEYREDVVADTPAGPHPWRDDVHRWSVTIPDGWIEHPAQERDAAECVVRFAPPSAEFGLDPFVVAGWAPAEFHTESWEEFERVFTRELFERMASESFGGTRSKVESNHAVFDKHRGRMTVTFTNEFGGLRWKGVIVNCFGRDGAAVLSFTAMEKDFESARPSFDALVESFRFDDGYGWEDAFPIASLDWGAVAWKTAAILGVGALLAAAVWFVRTRESKADIARARDRLKR